MPKTRAQEPHDAKAAEIVAAAEQRLRNNGAAAFSVAAIARELGVAQNTVYWYFPSKDHLFVAALEQVFSGLVQTKREQNLALVDEILGFVDRFADVCHVRTAMVERARHSPVVAEFADNFQSTLDLMMGHALRPHVAADRIDDVVRAFSAMVEGLLVQGTDADLRQRTVRVALEALTDRRLGAAVAAKSRTDQRDR